MKDFFYFTKSQRIGITVILILLLVCSAGRIILPHLLPTENEENLFAEEFRQFRQQLQDRKQARQKAKKADFTELFAFNPNTLDSAGFVRLGLKPYMAQRIVKYRNAGGHFKNADDFGKIYGLPENLYAKLKPYINIPAQPKKTQKTPVSSEEIASQPKKKEERRIAIVELNAADTTALKTLPGIGGYYARKIVAYRKKLGGFVEPDQLLEVEKFTEAQLRKVLPHIAIDTLLVKKIPVNRASVDWLKSHPYLNFYTAKAIYDRRRQLGRVTSPDELRNLPEADDEAIEKIMPYLSFD